VDAEQLRRYVIRPTLRHIGAWSEAAEELVLGTACQESGCGRYVRQLGDGPARGICQMEPATHDDIWENWLAYRAPYAERVLQLMPHWPRGAERLTVSLAYSVAMCRVHYLRVPDPLPAPGDLHGQAAYYKRFYNTRLGAATVEEYVANWRRYVG
jgi:hypothetical protein